MKHAITGYQTYGCRCEVCVEAQRVKQQRQLARYREASCWANKEERRAEARSRSQRRTQTHGSTPSSLSSPLQSRTVRLEPGS